MYRINELKVVCKNNINYLVNNKKSKKIKFIIFIYIKFYSL